MKNMQDTKNEKVMVGMSGGVDSSAAAFILKNEGFDVCGATLRLFVPKKKQAEADLHLCGAESDIADAKAVSDKLGINHFVFDLQDDFEKCVINNFISVYKNGGTPNPCIECNRHIKFSKMLDLAFKYGCGFIATGHYVQKEYDQNTGRYLLKKALDHSKDQTYVLYHLTQHQLKHTIFPLGRFLKPEIREIAEKENLINARKPDSQDICFVPDGDYVSFIKNKTKKAGSPGNFINEAGEVLGRHSGIINYTIGQRKGLGITFGEPRFVTKKDAEKNTVTLGKSEQLFSDTLYAENVNWIMIENLNVPMRVKIKARYKQSEADGTIYPQANGYVKAVFDTPQQAISPGQAVVFYSGDYVVGGGTII